ncbi:MAG: hypothetical protein ACR2K5_11795 [Pseudolabrys sp.]
MPKDWLIPLVLFAALVLTLSLHALAVSGHFPAAHRSAPLSSGPGPAILYGSMALAIACALIGIVSAARLIPWYASIIGGGLAILAAPLVLQRFPDRFVDGRAALIWFAAVGAGLGLILFWMANGGFALP